MTEAKYLGLKEAETMTDLSMCDLHYLDPLEQDIYHLRSGKIQLKKVIGTKHPAEEALDEDYEQVQSYTGLPSFATLTAVFNFVSLHIRFACTFGFSSTFSAILLVFMKNQADFLR